MPDLSEESLWHWGCLSSSLRDTGEPAQRHVETVLGFGLNAPDSSSRLKFLLPSQLLKVKRGYSPSVASFFFLPPLPWFYHNAPVVEAVSACVWGLGLWDAGCLPRVLHARGKECPERGLGWLETAVKFIKQGCSHQICRNGKVPLVQVKQSPLKNAPEVTIFTSSHWKGFLPNTPLCVSKVLITVLWL